MSSFTFIARRSDGRVDVFSKDLAKADAQSAIDDWNAANPHLPAELEQLPVCLGISV